MQQYMCVLFVPSLKGCSCQPNFVVIGGAVAGGVVLLIVVVVALIIVKRKRNLLCRSLPTNDNVAYGRRSVIENVACEDRPSSIYATCVLPTHPQMEHSKTLPAQQTNGDMPERELEYSYATL